MGEQTDNAVKTTPEPPSLQAPEVHPLSPALRHPAGVPDWALPIDERIEVLVDRLRVYCAQAHLEAERARADRKFMVDFMLGVHDLLVEFARTSDWMKFKRDIQILKNREGARASVDNWFWRPEKELDLREQLMRRAAYLKAQNYPIDRQWDLLVDYVSGWTGSELDEALLRQVLKEVHHVGPV
jgi:hypothetical protein